MDVFTDINPSLKQKQMMRILNTAKYVFLIKMKVEWLTVGGLRLGLTKQSHRVALVQFFSSAKKLPRIVRAVATLSCLVVTVTPAVRRGRRPGPTQAGKVDSDLESES